MVREQIKKINVYKYNLSEKQAIIFQQCQANLSNRAVAKKYLINESTFRYWKSTINLEYRYQGKKFTLHPGPAPIVSILLILI
jgi:transposase-like protein